MQKIVNQNSRMNINDKNFFILKYFKISLHIFNAIYYNIKSFNLELNKYFYHFVMQSSDKYLYSCHHILIFHFMDHIPKHK